MWGGVGRALADDTAYCYSMLNDTTYYINASDSSSTYSAFQSVYPSATGSSLYLCYPAGATLFSGDYITITAEDASLVHLSGYNRSYYGDDSSTFSGCGYAVLGTSISSNTLSTEYAIDSVKQIIYTSSSDNAWQSIISVTPTTAGALGFKAAHTSSRMVGLYDLTAKEWLGVESDKSTAPYITGEAKANHQYLIVGDGPGHYLYAITFVPQSTIQRTIAGGYATFSATSNVTKPEGVTAYTGKYNATNKSVTLTEYTGSVLPKNTGFILAGNDGDIELSVTTDEAGEEVPSDNELIATGDDGYTAGSNTYGLFTDGLFYKATEGTTVGANRAVLNITTETTTEAIAMTITDGEDSSETTGISSVERATATADVYHNLQGMRVSHPTQGLYIVNGKKVLIK